MCWDVGMTLFISLVLLHKMKVISSNNDCPDHLCTVASARNDTAPDRNFASKWAFLVNVCPLNGISGGLEAKTNTLVEAVTALSWPLSLASLLGAQEHLWLLQKGLLSLFRHDC